MPESGPRLVIGMVGVLLMSFILYFAFRNSMEPDAEQNNWPRDAAEAFEKGDTKKAQALIETICQRTSMVAMRRVVATTFGASGVMMSLGPQPARGEAFLELCIAGWNAKIGGDSPQEGILHGYLAEVKATLGKSQEASSEYETCISKLENGTDKDQVERGYFLRGYADHLVKSGRTAGDPQVASLRNQEETIYQKFGRRN